jgi:hypothetical protein
VQQGLQVLLVPQARKVLLAQLGLQGHKVEKELVAQQVQLVQRVPQVQQGQRVPQAQQAQLVPQAQLGLD